MTELAPSVGERGPWWRESWVSLAGVVAVAQFAAFWVLSPRDQWGPASAPTPRTRYQSTGSHSATGTEWLWLHSPGLSLTTSGQDFSQEAWLRGAPLELAADDAPAPAHPLPFQPATRTGIEIGLGRVVPRPEADPVPRWTLPRPPLLARDPGPVPLLAAGRATIVEGLGGWRLADGQSVPALAPGGAAAAPTAVKVRLDEFGEPASPPVVWESSGQPAVDELALRWVRGLRWSQGMPGSPRNPEGRLPDPAAGTSGVLWIEWAAPPAPAPAPTK